MKLIIDGDGCPVVDEAIAVSTEFNIPCTIVCDSSHVFDKPNATTITVSKGADSADLAIVNLLSPNDIVITQDYGLAALCLARRAVILNQDGMEYTQDNIDSLLLSRHTAKEIMRRGGRVKGNKKRSPTQDKAFVSALRELIKRML